MSLSTSRVFTCAFLAAVAAHPAAGQAIDTMALRAHTRFLSSDLLGGRGTGSAGDHYAAAYIESQLRLLGLRGAFGDGQFRQSVPLRAFTVDTASRVAVRSDGGATTFETPRGFIVGPAGRGALRGFAGEGVFVGDAAQAPPDLPSVEGRVVVMLGTPGTEAVGLLPAWQRAGAAGVVSLIPDTAQFALLARSRGPERLYVDAEVGDPIWQPGLPSIIAGPALSAAILRGAPIPLAATRGEPFAPVPLGRVIQVDIRGSERAVAAANVGGILPGRDAARSGEHIVYTAHHDHLGIVPALAGGDSIYNGFSDNAAGVAMLLAIARVHAQSPLGPSVLFLFLTGEERGLLGSSFFAASPPFPLDSISALINLDAGAPPAPPVSWRIAGGEGAPLGDLAAAVADSRGWTASLSGPSPNSDYWPFLARGVPSIFIIPGGDWEDVTPAQRDALRLRWDRYHRPDDEWAPDFPFQGLARYAEFALLVGRAAADSR
jgi:hypothetical protein